VKFAPSQSFEREGRFLPDPMLHGSKRHANLIAARREE